FAGYNFVPNPAARANASQLTVNTPDGLLIQLGIQIQENLGGKLAITSDGATIYAISQSGFLVLPVGTLKNAPIAAPDSNVAMLAINIIPNVRVFQNSRNAEASGTVIPVDIGGTTTGLTDMLPDRTRQRLYIANPALNRLEVFDTQKRQFLNPITVGQLPCTMAFGSDGNTLYVANSGGENISIVDLTSGKG